jgi:hypothetical protein
MLSAIMPSVIMPDVILPKVVAFLDWNANDKKRKKRGNKKWKYFETDPLMKGKKTGKQGKVILKFPWLSDFNF